MPPRRYNPPVPGFAPPPPPREKETAIKTPARKRKMVKTAPSNTRAVPKKRRGRKPGSKNKNVRKDKGTKKGRKALPGMKVSEMRKTITAWKKRTAPPKTPKTGPAMKKYIKDHNIRLSDYKLKLLNQAK